MKTAPKDLVPDGRFRHALRRDNVEFHAAGYDDPPPPVTDRDIVIAFPASRAWPEPLRASTQKSASIVIET